MPLNFILVFVLDEQLINQLQNFRMKCHDFQLIKVIGKGAFGEVQLVRHKKNNQVYAMKLLDKMEMVYFNYFEFL